MLERSTMWASESFGTLELLINFLNDRDLDAGRCKVVVVREDGGDQPFHLLYQLDDEPRQALAAVTVEEADALPPVDADDAVGAARAIIAEAQREE